MNNNHKTLLITTALATRLLSVANVLSNTFVTTNSQMSDIDTIDGFTIKHDHVDYGQQAIVADRLDDNTWVVSFAGRQEFQDLIGTEGWTSSAQALENYFLLLDPEFVPFFADLAVTLIGESKTLISLSVEDAMTVDPRHLVDEGTVESVEAKPSLGERLLNAVSETALNAAAEYGNVVDTAIDEDFTLLEEMQSDSDTEAAAADALEDGAPAKERLLAKLGRFVRSPAGLIFCLSAGAIAATAAGALVYRKVDVAEVPQV